MDKREDPRWRDIYDEALATAKEDQTNPINLMREDIQNLERSILGLSSQLNEAAREIQLAQYGSAKKICDAIRSVIVTITICFLVILFALSVVRVFGTSGLMT